jgi:hypothetical protein
MITEIAVLVQPIMKKHGWFVPKLEESNFRSKNIAGFVFFVFLFVWWLT